MLIINKLYRMKYSTPMFVLDRFNKNQEYSVNNKIETVDKNDLILCLENDKPYHDYYRFSFLSFKNNKLYTNSIRISSSRIQAFYVSLFEEV